MEPHVTAGAVTNTVCPRVVVSRVSLVRKLAQTRLYRSRCDESSRNDVGDAGRGHVRTRPRVAKRTEERTRKKKRFRRRKRKKKKKKSEGETDVIH